MQEEAAVAPDSRDKSSGEPDVLAEVEPDSPAADGAAETSPDNRVPSDPTGAPDGDATLPDGRGPDTRAPEPGPEPAAEPGPEPAPEAGKEPGVELAPELGPEPAAEPGPEPAKEPGPEPGNDGGTVPSCANTTPLAGGNVAFNTVGPFCFVTCDGIQNGWGCSNFSDAERTVKVNGTTVGCGKALPPKHSGGYYYFDVTAGPHTWDAIWWTGPTATSCPAPAGGFVP